MSRAQEITPLPGLPALVNDAKNKGVKPANMATAIGMDRSHFDNLINQRKGASLAVAQKIARYFEVPIESLLEPTPEKTFV